MKTSVDSEMGKNIKRGKNQVEEEEDIISKSIGQFGRWQLKHTFILSLFNIPCTWHIFSPTFLAAPRDTWCARPDKFKNVTPSVWKNYSELEDDFCFVYNVMDLNISADNFTSMRYIENKKLIGCTSWEFEGSERTILSDFSLMCDRRYLHNLADMMFLGGVAIGGLICGILSDKYGRKRTLMFSVLLQTIIGILIAFSPWYEMYVTLRAALGFISVSVVFSGFVLSIELVGGHWRTVAGISYLFPVSLSYMSISAIAWFIRDWRYLELALSLPGLIFLGLWWVLPESPRWLMAMERTNEVIEVLQEAAKTNGRELPPNIDKQLMPVNTNVETESVSVMDLFRTRQICKKTLLLFIIWFSMYLVYYGLVLNLSNIGGNLYINSALSGAVEIPAIAISIVILIKGGRRWPLALTLIIAGVAASCTLPIYLASLDLQWLITTLSMISKFTVSSSNAIVPVFTAELYPTTIRNIGVGASNVSAGVALMLVPYLFELQFIHKVVPMAVIGICGIVGGCCVLFLPETANRPLMDTLKEEVEAERSNTAQSDGTANNNS